jgi:U3 small nucleolar RNA-associated protein 23
VQFPAKPRDNKSSIPHLICPSGTSVITQCCIYELYIRGKSHQPAVDLAKSLERRKCNHKEAISGNECIASLIGRFSLQYNLPTSPHMSADRIPCALYIPGETNKHRYVIATQSRPLRVSLRAVPGVPIVHINRSVMVLEPASDATLQSKQRVRLRNFTNATLFALIRSTYRPNTMRSGHPSQRRWH